MSRSYSATLCVLSFPLCLALAACDSPPDARLLIRPSQPLAHDCLERLPGQMVPVVSVAQVRRARPHKGVEYEVRWRDSNSISVFQDFDLNQIEIALTSKGSGSAEQQRENLGVLKDVRRGVFNVCNLDPAKDPVDRSCSGETCKDPAYPDL